MKKLMLGLLVAFAVTAEAETVTINKVETTNPWNSAKGEITVGYTLAGIDSKCLYKVAFDVSANDETKGVTNDMAKLANQAYTKTIDTRTLFGKETVAKSAKVKVSLIAVTPPPDGQLWAGGPIWAETNVGSSEVAGHSEYGGLYAFDNAQTAVSAPWRLPTDAEFQALRDNCDRQWDDTKKGVTFTGKGVYSVNSIFLPAAGCNYGRDSRLDAETLGVYWSSTEVDSTTAWAFYLSAGTVQKFSRTWGLSVRAVQNAPDGGTEGGEKVVATAEATFWLGPGCESCPWTVGAGVTAYVNGVALVVEGSGAVASTPWVPFADGIAKLVKAEGVTGLEGIMATLPDLANVNGLTLDELASAGMLGALKAGFSTIAVEGGKAYLGVSVCTNGDMTAMTEGWEKTVIEKAEVVDGEAILTVPATAEKGFMILQSGDAKVQADELKLSGGKVFTGDY